MAPEVHGKKKGLWSLQGLTLSPPSLFLWCPHCLPLRKEEDEPSTSHHCVSTWTNSGRPLQWLLETLSRAQKPSGSFVRVRDGAGRGLRGDSNSLWHCCWRETAQVQIPAPPRTGCVTSGKLRNSSVPLSSLNGER